MNKEQIEIMRDIIKIFNRATFSVSGAELIDFGNRIKKYAQLIMELEKEIEKQ